MNGLYLQWPQNIKQSGIYFKETNRRTLFNPNILQKKKKKLILTYKTINILL